MAHVLADLVAEHLQLLEGAAEHRAGARRGLDVDHHRSRYRAETLGVSRRIPDEAGSTVVHIVAWVGDHTLHRQQLSPRQLSGEGGDRPRPQHRIRRRQIDQIGIMRHDPPNPRLGHRRLELGRFGGRHGALTPLIGGLGEDLDRGGPDGQGARRRLGKPARDGDMRPDQVVAFQSGSALGARRSALGTCYCTRARARSSIATSESRL